MILLFLLLCGAAWRLSRKKMAAGQINDTVRVALYMTASRILLLALAFTVLYFKYPGQDLIALLSQNGDVPHFLHLAEYGYSVGDEHENLMVPAFLPGSAKQHRQARCSLFIRLSLCVLHAVCLYGGTVFNAVRPVCPVRTQKEMDPLRPVRDALCAYTQPGRYYVRLCRI